MGEMFTGKSIVANVVHSVSHKTEKFLCRNNTTQGITIYSKDFFFYITYIFSIHCVLTVLTLLDPRFPTNFIVYFCDFHVRR